MTIVAVYNLLTSFCSVIYSSYEVKITKIMDFRMHRFGFQFPSSVTKKNISFCNLEIISVLIFQIKITKLFEKLDFLFFFDKVEKLKLIQTSIRFLI